MKIRRNQNGKISQVHSKVINVTAFSLQDKKLVVYHQWVIRNHWDLLQYVSNFYTFLQYQIMLDFFQIIWAPKDISRCPMRFFKSHCAHLFHTTKKPKRAPQMWSFLAKCIKRTKKVSDCLFLICSLKRYLKL